MIVVRCSGYADFPNCDRKQEGARHRPATFSANQTNFGCCLSSAKNSANPKLNTSIHKAIHESLAKSFHFHTSLPHPTTIRVFYLPPLHEQYFRDDCLQMRLFLVRHGETEHNIAGLLAGVTDSLLTNHGLLQAERLGSYLIKKKAYRFSQVFASDLNRAFRTANEICLSQTAESPRTPVSPIQLAVLREQDFGSFELLPWNRSSEVRETDPKPTDADFKLKETKASMRVRADTFLDDSLLPLLALDDEDEQFVAVVSHGLFLGALWRALLVRFKPSTVSFNPEAGLQQSKKPLEYLPSWSNTGYLELSLRKVSPPSNDETKSSDTDNNANLLMAATMTILAVNSKEHLLNLKRTRGVGSGTSDDKQKRVDTFFKKRKLEDTPLVSAPK